MEFFSPLSNVDINQRGRLTSDMQDTLLRGFLLAEQNDAHDLSNEAREESVNDMFSLPYFQASLFATILEDSLSEMRILVECNTELRLVKAAVDMTQLLALKYDVQQPAHCDELDVIDAHNLTCDEYKINKLDADRKMLQNSWMSTYLDFSLRRSYQGLNSQVHNITDRIEHYNFIKEEEARNKMTRRDLAKQLRQHRNHAKTVYYDTDSVIEQLKTAVEDAAANAEIRSRYVASWQRARTEQNDQLIRCKESAPSMSIEYYKQKYDQEHRVHTEVELLTTITINENLQKVETWMAKYDKDIEEIDLKIQVIKNKHVVQMEKRQELEETLSKHADLITLWVYFKDAREKARLYREKMTDAAIAVQAWWRGILVRNQLGPYKPKPKRRGGGGAKDKGKKK